MKCDDKAAAPQNSTDKPLDQQLMMRILGEIVASPAPQGTDLIGYEKHLLQLTTWNAPVLSGDFVDIGAFLGGGTNKLARFLDKAGSNYHVIAIDTFDINSDDTKNTGGVKMSDIYNSLIRNGFGVKSQREIYNETIAGLSNIITVEADSISIELPTNNICFAIIDGSHEPKHVRHDFELVWNKLLVDGVVALHNFNHDLPLVTETINRIRADYAAEIERAAFNDATKTVYIQKASPDKTKFKQGMPPLDNQLLKNLYVLCPSNSVTGGPDALHQLVHVARTLGFEASLVYYPPSKEIPERYKCYDIQLSETIPDDASSIVVVPEVCPTYLVQTYPNTTKIFWWLSWDYGAQNFPIVNRPDVLQACQSTYAMDMVRRRGITADNVCMLSDITRSEYLTSLPKARRVDRVIFNPAKGKEYTASIIESNPDLLFVPVQNMKPAEVRNLLHTSKVYIDFGHHPGKDRVPREAAISGCCVITANDRGASAYLQDIPIPGSYKFSTCKFDPTEIGKRIRHCFRNYESAQCDFDLYRASIRAEKWIFEEEVTSMLERLNCRRTEGSPHRIEKSRCVSPN